MSADTHTGAPHYGVSISATPAVAASTAATPTATAPAGDAPLTWAKRSTVLPVLGRPQPRLRQMLGVCGWAALLGTLGLAVGIRGFWADLMDLTPSWYEPTMIGVGLVGIALTVGAFVTVHRRRAPYVLLAAATGVLAYAIALTATTI